MSNDQMKGWVEYDGKLFPVVELRLEGGAFVIEATALIDEAWLPPKQPVPVKVFDPAMNLCHVVPHLAQTSHLVYPGDTYTLTLRLSVPEESKKGLL